ncbi:MAG: hypothetical protein HWD61_01020 [Parachlamydiaceae bacterium]|nr:MAG: hypothetical protein HWD61_01020 [Parachlamydiaceae bacterium]
MAIGILRVGKDLVLNFAGGAILASFAVDPADPASCVKIVAFAFLVRLY